MRVIRFSFLALLMSCSVEQTPATSQGELWADRKRIADALQLRTGKLAGSWRKPIRSCRPYWESGDPTDARWPPVSWCDQKADELSRRLTELLDKRVTPGDVRDAALWRYVAARAKL